MSFSTWREIRTDKIQQADMCVLGIPFDGAASVGKGAAHAPEAIRKCTEVLPPVNSAGQRFPEIRVFDQGDVEFSLNWEAFFKRTEEEAAQLLRSGKFCMFIGGDHSVTIPLAKAFASCYEGKKIGVIHFDSHPDLCDEYEDSPWSHACPLKRVLDDHISPRDLAQVGIRSYESEEIDLYEAHPELLVIKAHDIFKEGYQKAIDRLIANFQGYDAIYITLDIDVLDPAFAPGTGTPEAGGLSSRELMEIINQLFARLPIRAMDIVEVSPPLDTVNQITSWAAVKVIYEVLAHLKK
ncbi:agmatinase [bacterium 210820-DFI.6.37]|nr:agmatinase [bacterium 210820-DFI.6.37]